MMTDLSHIYGGDNKERAVNSNKLTTRLDINKRYQSKDFTEWLFKRLSIVPGESILDVGCGTGAQSLRFLKEVGQHGSVSALDLSEDSIELLINKSGDDTRLVAVADDMANLEEVIDRKFREKKYTLAHSSYALYYSPSREDVLRTMIESLYGVGRLAIFTPVTPHGMVDIARRFGDVPDAVLDSLRYGPDVLEPIFRKAFVEVEIHYFQSEMRVTNKEDFIDFYKATTYFKEEALPEIGDFADQEISRQGKICYEKNGYLIIGRDRK